MSCSIFSQSSSYQVQFGLLEAGRYGAPQSRIRFFLFAAKHGYTLPSLPQPTHESMTANSLKILLTPDVTILPMRTMAGTASHPATTIEDAIGDLPLFDWQNPGRRSAATRGGRISNDIPAVKCDREESNSGLPEPHEYRHTKPMTTFQRHCRGKEPVQALQHFTRTYPKKTVER